MAWLYLKKLIYLIINIYYFNNYFMTELYINDSNINDLDNCNYLNITTIGILTSKNINLLLDKLYKFTNLQQLRLCSNQITEIKGLDNLVNLQVLDLSYNQIIEIKGLDNLVNLQKLILFDNQITEIKGLNTLAELQELQLHYNQITEIKGLNTLTSLQKLSLNNNNISEIKGLNTLVGLKNLKLYSNQIKEIKDLENLINLEILYLSNNNISEIKGLNTLVGLKDLKLANNQITEIKKLDNLVNLKKLNLYNNQITELPLSLCNLRNLINFDIINNPIEYIPLPVQRWLDRLNNEITVSNMIYNNTQNIHNHHIQNSFQVSLNNIFKDKKLLKLRTIKQQILENNVLLEQTKREILNYCDDKTTHSILLITYSDLLIYVWSRIISSTNTDEILAVLNQEISDGLCMCFTGRLTRLLNTLVGFFPDIELQISDSEQITNIIMRLKNKFADEELKEAVKKELFDRQYSESIINEWLDYI